MITFAVAAAAILLAALSWILVPLLKRRPVAAIASEASNLAVLRDARAELEADLANGTISADQYDVSRTELDRRVLEETLARPTGTRSPRSARARSPARSWPR